MTVFDLDIYILSCIITTFNKCFVSLFINYYSSVSTTKHRTISENSSPTKERGYPRRGILQQANCKVGKLCINRAYLYVKRQKKQNSNL